MSSLKYYKVISDGKTSMFFVNDGLAVNKANGKIVLFADLHKAVIVCKKVGINIDIVQINYEEY